jgi:tetratricopeptide (TPR) repeat protein
MTKKLALALFLSFAATQFVSAQSNKEIAASKAEEAIRLEDDEGKYDEALVLLKEAQQLDPGNITYPYELAYTYGAKKEYKKASDILEPLLKHKDVFARVYQALGNNYDYQGLPSKAIATYKEGLKKFPNSGELYLELGTTLGLQKEYDSALSYYEKGIQVAPEFPSNYYRATKVFQALEQEVWSMIYGELFMNLERNGKRTAEISKLLFDIYKNKITFPTDTSVSVSFLKNTTMNLADFSDPSNVKLPFSFGCYEKGMAVAVAGEKSIDIISLDRIRTRFLKGYLKNGDAIKYPNVLFEYQQKIMNAGHLEAYNYWLLMQGDEEKFSQWKAINSNKWDSFLAWFSKNGIKLDQDHKFTRPN